MALSGGPVSWQLTTYLQVVSTGEVRYGIDQCLAPLIVAIPIAAAAGLFIYVVRRFTRR